MILSYTDLFVVVAYDMSGNKYASSEAIMFWDELTSTAIMGQTPRFLDVFLLLGANDQREVT